MHSKSVRHPKSEIRKRRLPDRDQIEYFRLGFTSIFKVSDYESQFTDFWHNLPESFRDEDEDELTSARRRLATVEQHYALNEDEFKHNIHDLGGDLSTNDLIIKPPHCLIQEKIGVAVEHYRTMQNEKEEKKQHDILLLSDNDNDLNNDIINLTITDSPRPKRRRMNTRSTNQKNQKYSNSKEELSDTEDDDDMDNFVVNDDSDEEYKPNDDAEMFGIKKEPIYDIPVNSSSPVQSVKARRRSRRRKNNQNKNYNNGYVDSDESVDLNINTDLNLIRFGTKQSPSKKSKSKSPQNIENENENESVLQPLFRRKRGRPGKDDDVDIEIVNKPTKRKRGRKRKRQQNDGLMIVDGVRNKRINERPHVLFAANVEMPYFDQLVEPFKKFQDRRSQHKSINSKKEVNSVTKLTRNHRLQQIEKEKGCKLLRENQCLLKVAIFHSNKSSERYTKSHEFVVLSSQTLSELKDEIYCLMDITPIGAEIQNSYFFIEDTFYDDCRHSNDVNFNRLSTNIIEWSRCDNHWKQTGVYLTKNMEDTKFKDLQIRLGSHYLYVHQGDCQHVIVFTDCRISTKYDCNNCYAYPICTYRQILKRQKCGVCEMYPAKYVTYGDKLTTHNPFFFCQRCYHPFHYDKKGKLLYDDFQVFDYIHD